jgi:hypothetical protein
MKAKIGSIQIDGTPEEIADLIRKLEISPFNLGDMMTKRDFLQPQVDPDAGPFVSEEIAFRVLKRRSLSAEQLTMLALLCSAGEDWTSAKAIQKALNYKTSQFSGMLGAFGKRVASTPGYRDGTTFFDQEWDYEEDCFRYRLPEDVIDAVKRVGI